MKTYALKIFKNYKKDRCKTFDENLIERKIVNIKEQAIVSKETDFLIAYAKGKKYFF